MILRLPKLAWKRLIGILAHPTEECSDGGSRAAAIFGVTAHRTAYSHCPLWAVTTVAAVPNGSALWSVLHWAHKVAGTFLSSMIGP